MGKIKVLPEMLINKIAAGEVIEKPASVVKELVENSLDANAKNISVTVKHGGKQLIRVTDNGEGMGSEDAISSLQRHATSKIENLEDIFRIRSFGFRGEALPSIAAVSRLTLLTRPSEAESGTEVKATGGVIESVREAGVGLGTTVEAADLFFNIPARKKFLRSERSEFVGILDTLTVFALGNPTVDFRLYKDNKLVAEFPSCASLRERIAQIHDEDVVEALIPLQVNTPEIKISGFITAPEVNRINRTGQYFFINARPIKSPALSFSLLHGYEEMLPRGRFPLAFLFFSIELSRVDVNVHPNKKEVRIENEREVQTLLIEAVQQALHTKNKFHKVQVVGTRRRSENAFFGGRERSASYQEYSDSPALNFIREAPAELSTVEPKNKVQVFSYSAPDQATKEGNICGAKSP
ncbi:MAG TPA: DNA mismatch repair endonuclease MutL, partial [Thermodesulfobacteriota bacterium]|nr:DNA mismatch repair endonuclease MutL [Thermodesulfobacteriota bacterium]